jgi:hypothetical protein
VLGQGTVNGFGDRSEEKTLCSKQKTERLLRCLVTVSECKVTKPVFLRASVRSELVFQIDYYVFQNLFSFVLELTVRVLGN